MKLKSDAIIFLASKGHVGLAVWEKEYPSLGPGLSPAGPIIDMPDEWFIRTGTGGTIALTKSKGFLNLSRLGYALHKTALINEFASHTPLYKSEPQTYEERAAYFEKNAEEFFEHTHKVTQARMNKLFAEAEQLRYAIRKVETQSET